MLVKYKIITQKYFSVMMLPIKLKACCILFIREKINSPFFSIIALETEYHEVPSFVSAHFIIG